LPLRELFARPLQGDDINAGRIPDHVITRMNFGVNQRDPMGIGLAIDAHAVLVAVRFDESHLIAVRTDRHQRLDSHAHRVMLCELVRIMRAALVIGTQETLRRPASVTLHELQERILAGEVGDGAAGILDELGDSRLLDRVDGDRGRVRRQRLRGIVIM